MLPSLILEEVSRRDHRWNFRASRILIQFLLVDEELGPQGAEFWAPGHRGVSGSAAGSESLLAPPGCVSFAVAAAGSEPVPRLSSLHLAGFF